MKACGYPPGHRPSRQHRPVERAGSTLSARIERGRDAIVGPHTLCTGTAGLSVTANGVSRDGGHTRGVSQSDRQAVPGRGSRLDWNGLGFLGTLQLLDFRTGTLRGLPASGEVGRFPAGVPNLQDFEPAGWVDSRNGCAPAGDWARGLSGKRLERVASEHFLALAYGRSRLGHLADRSGADPQTRSRVVAGLDKRILPGPSFL
jgi:hypothetical protein